jgi:hypothetical protein
MPSGLIRNLILNPKKAHLGRYLRFFASKAARLATFIATLGSWAVTKFSSEKALAFIAAISGFAAATFAAWQGSIANQTLIASNRPWISIEPIIASDFIWNAEGARITFKFKLKNIGHAPADVVTPITSAVYLMVPGHMDPAGRQHQLCDTPKFPWRGLLGFTIFPDETDDSEANGELIPRKDIDSAFHRDNGQTIEITPTLIGCVKYRYALDNLEHQTGFIRILSWIDPAQPERLSGFDPIKSTVPMDRIKFSKIIAPALAN